jgi:hypothetical protein
MINKFELINVTQIYLANKSRESHGRAFREGGFMNGDGGRPCSAEYGGCALISNSQGWE